MNSVYDDCSTYLRFYLILLFLEGVGYFFVLYKVLISLYFLASAGNVYFNLLLFTLYTNQLQGVEAQAQNAKH